MKMNNNILNLFRACVLAVFGLAPTHSALAAELTSDNSVWYTVSMVIFKNPYAKANGDPWSRPDRLELSIPEQTVEFITEGDPANTAFVEQPLTDPEFLSIVGKLDSNQNYRIYSSKSWRQPGYSRQTPIPVRIRAGRSYGDNYLLEGTVAVTAAKFLHFQSNLWMSEYQELPEPLLPEPLNEQWSTVSSSGSEVIVSNSLGEPQSLDTEAATEESAPSPFDALGNYTRLQATALQESRRMELGELHYLDHPLFGILVKVTRE